MLSAPVVVNGRCHAAPKVPAIFVCLDGCEPVYLEAALSAGLMPALARLRDAGTARIAHSVIPSFTNPNNMSIATGRPPAAHGICGNYLYDPETGEEVTMNDPRFLRSPTVFAGLHDTGARVAIVTAKDKLRALLAAGLDVATGRAVCFSSERSAATTLGEHGIEDAAGWLGRPVPGVCSAELSEVVFAAGVRLLGAHRPDAMYLTTTDFIQHTQAPGTTVANALYAMFDGHLAQLDAAGAAIVVTADHGMKPKHHPDGAPAVVYLQDLLDNWVGAGAARVILPITDPCLVHHGALGSFATAYLPAGADAVNLAARLAAVPGIALAIPRTEAVTRFELPADRIGDLVVISDEGMTIGTSEDRHDLAALTEPLRSHGGLSEQEVPFIVNRRVDLGKLIAATAGSRRCVLELGGNDPLIVLSDLSDDDLARAAGLAVPGATRNSGQRCTAVKRILVQEAVADRFVPLVLERARALVFGNPSDPATDLGTVVSAEAAALFDARVQAAAEAGAEVLCHPGRQGAPLPPIVVNRLRPEMELVHEETFGPVVPILRVPDDDEATIATSNRTAFGLSAGVCTRDFRRMQRYIAGLKVGTVNIWEVPGYRTEMSPFGGVKDSGNGTKEEVVEAMKSYTTLKTFSLPWP